MFTYYKGVGGGVFVVGQERAGEGFDLVSLSEEDIEGISDLITGMDHGRSDQRLRDKSPDYYRWMYLENPAGRAIVYSVRHLGRVVASFAVAPKIFQVDGRRVPIGKTMDMFTDPQYQGRGLIKRCTAAVFAEARAAGLAGWYVTPSVNSYPIFTGRWGYAEDLDVVYRVKVLSLAPVMGAMAGSQVAWIGRAVDRARSHLPRRGMRRPQGWGLETLTHLSEEVDQLWSEVAPGYRVAQIRDASYLTWRYVSNPDDYTILGLRHEGRLAGLVVLTSTVRRGVAVGEVVDHVCAADDGEAFRLLIGAALEHSRAQGHAMVQAWSIRGTRQDARMRRAGLRWRRPAVKFLVSPGFPEPAVHDPEAWLLTQGDGNDV